MSNRSKLPVDSVLSAELADAHALRALHIGSASPEQQTRALNWILHVGCEVGGMPWFETDRETAFALGRLFVAKQIGRLLICDLSTLRRENVPETKRTAKS